MAYGLEDACKRYSYDADIELFYGILTETLPEEVYYLQVAMVNEFKAMLKAVDVKENQGQASGYINKKKFLGLLRRHFPHKSDMQLQLLKDAVDRDQPGSMVEYKNLFEEDREGNQQAFAEQLRGQHLKEPHDFATDVENAICLLDTENTGITNKDAIVKAIAKIDPDKQMQEVQTIVQETLEDMDTTNTKDIAAHKRLMRESFVQRLVLPSAVQQQEQESMREEESSPCIDIHTFMKALRPLLVRRNVMRLSSMILATPTKLALDAKKRASTSSKRRSTDYEKLQKRLSKPASPTTLPPIQRLGGGVPADSSPEPSNATSTLDAWASSELQGGMFVEDSPNLKGGNATQHTVTPARNGSSRSQARTPHSVTFSDDNGGEGTSFTSAARKLPWEKGKGTSTKESAQ